MTKFVIWFSHVTAALRGVCDCIWGRYGGKENGEWWLHSQVCKSLLTRHDLRCARYCGGNIYTRTKWMIVEQTRNYNNSFVLAVIYYELKVYVYIFFCAPVTGPVWPRGWVEV